MSKVDKTYSLFVSTSQGFYCTPNFVNTKTFTHFRGTDTQTDRRTDRYDVTLEATLS